MHGVGRLGVIDHAPGLGVAGDRRAAQALEQAELDLMRAQGVQGVKALGKAGQRLAGQAENQVSVQVGVRLRHQPVQVGQGFGVVLPARDALLHLGVEALDADFELQHTGRKLRDQDLEPVRQLVRDQLKVHKLVRGRWSRRQAVQKKLQDARRGLDLQVEGAVHKLELPRAALIQPVQLGQKRVQVKGPGGLVK